MGRYGIETEDVVNWLIERERRQTQPPTLLPEGIDPTIYGSKVELHLSSHFWVWKPPQEQQKVISKSGYPEDIDPNLLPDEIRQELIEERGLDKNGNFTFFPGQLVLGQTEEEVQIPNNESWRMGDHFVLKQTREIIRLTTHCGAPLLHPSSSGPQTHEIINKSESPLVVSPGNLICVTFIAEHDPISTYGRSKFKTQAKGEMRVSSPLSEHEKLLFGAPQTNRLL